MTIVVPSEICFFFKSVFSFYVTVPCIFIMVSIPYFNVLIILNILIVSIQQICYLKLLGI